MKGRLQIRKADLLVLARALGDEEVDEGESTLCIFERCLSRARDLNAPAKLFDGRPAHPKVQEWCGSLMDYAEERRSEMQKRGDEDVEKWSWYTVYGVVRDSTGRPCPHNFAPGSHKCMRHFCQMHIDEIEVDASCSHKFVDSKACLLCGVTANVLQAKDRREREQLEATPALPPLAMVEDRSPEQLKADGDVPCDHAGAEIAIDRATGEETCSDCGEAADADDWEEPDRLELDEDGMPIGNPRWVETPEQLKADGDEHYRCTACGKRQCDGTHVACPSYLLDHLRPEANAARVRALLEEEPSRP